MGSDQGRKVSHGRLPQRDELVHDSAHLGQDEHWTPGTTEFTKSYEVILLSPASRNFLLSFQVTLCFKVVEISY